MYLGKGWPRKYCELKEQRYESEGTGGKVTRMLFLVRDLREWYWEETTDLLQTGSLMVLGNGRSSLE